MNSWDFDRLKRVTKIKLLLDLIPLKKRVSIGKVDVTKGISTSTDQNGGREEGCMMHALP